MTASQLKKVFKVIPLRLKRVGLILHCQFFCSNHGGRHYSYVQFSRPLLNQQWHCYDAKNGKCFCGSLEMPWVNQQPHWYHGKLVLCGSHTIGDFPILIELWEFLHIYNFTFGFRKKTNPIFLVLCSFQRKGVNLEQEHGLGPYKLDIFTTLIKAPNFFELILNIVNMIALN